MGRVKNVLSALTRAWRSPRLVVRAPVRFGVAAGAMVAGALSVVLWGWWHGR